MNIKFLEQIFDDKETEHYLIEFLEKTYLVSVPSTIVLKRSTPNVDYEIKNETLKSVKSLLKTPIDGNIPIDKDYKIFQFGITVGSIEKFYKVDCDAMKFLKQAREKKKPLGFYGYCTLMREIHNKETEEADNTKNKN